MDNAISAQDGLVAQLADEQRRREEAERPRAYAEQQRTDVERRRMEALAEIERLRATIPPK